MIVCGFCSLERYGRSFNTVGLLKRTKAMFCLFFVWSTVWPPSFESVEETNKTLQATIAQHPPFGKFISHMAYGSTAASIGELKDLYTNKTQRRIYTLNIKIIEIEKELLKRAGAQQPSPPPPARYFREDPKDHMNSRLGGFRALTTHDLHESLRLLKRIRMTFP